MAKRSYYPFHMVDPLFAGLIDRSLCFGESRELSWMNLFYTKMVSRVLVGQKAGARVEYEPE